MAENKNCGNCGAALSSDSAVCEYCGTAVPGRGTNIRKPVTNESSAGASSQPKSVRTVMTEKDKELLTQQRSHKIYVVVGITLSVLCAVIIPGLFTFGIDKLEPTLKLVVLLVLCVIGPMANNYVLSLIFTKLNKPSMIPLRILMFWVQAIPYWVIQAFAYFPKS